MPGNSKYSNRRSLFGNLYSLVGYRFTYPGGYVKSRRGNSYSNEPRGGRPILHLVCAMNFDYSRASVLLLYSRPRHHEDERGGTKGHTAQKQPQQQYSVSNMISYAYTIRHIYEAPGIFGTTNTSTSTTYQYRVLYQVRSLQRVQGL